MYLIIDEAKVSEEAKPNDLQESDETNGESNNESNLYSELLIDTELYLLTNELSDGIEYSSVSQSYQEKRILE